MKKTVFGLGLLASLAFVAPAHAVVLHNYDLNGSLTDSKGGPTLVANGGVLGATGYEFDRQQGLTLTGLDIAGGDYTIEIGFYFNSFGGYQKILDFSGLASDSGLYALGKALNFYPLKTGPDGEFYIGQLVNLVISRDINSLEVTGSINGVEQFLFVDTRSQAVSNTLNFFIDDRPTRGVESGSGFVDYIRISNSAKVSAVPLPAALPLLLAGLAGLGVASRRRKTSKSASA
jgi:hypothetical protein